MSRFCTCILLLSSIAQVLGVKVPTKLLRDGHRMPMIALGTGRGTAPDGEPNDIVRQAVYDALEAGYRHIDTAAIYGDEEDVGAGINEAIKKGIVTRDEVFVTTKLWNTDHAENKVVPALRESLKRLGLSYVDLYLIHFPIAMKEDGSPDNIDYIDTWNGMVLAKNMSLAKSIGISNFNVDQVSRLGKSTNFPPVVHQIEVNPTLIQQPLVESSEDKQIAVMAYSPFGFMVGRNKADAPPPRIDEPVLVEMAQKYNKTTTQIVLRYLIERGLTPIPKSTNKARLRENLDVFDFHLTPEEVGKISAFNKDMRVISAKQWAAYPHYPFTRI